MRHLAPRIPVVNLLALLTMAGLTRCNTSPKRNTPGG